MFSLRPFRALSYVVSRGLRQMWQAPLVQLLAVATTAVCMLMLASVMLIWTNATGVTSAWGVDVPITVYLVDDADEDAVGELAVRLAAIPEVDRVESIGPAEAMRRLSDGLGGDASLLEGVDESVLPASIEVHLASSAASELGPALAVRIREFEVVEDVAVAGAWVEDAEDMLRTLNDLALGAAALVGFACMAIVWSTIRLAVYARRAEIQILRLVGGTHRFVRGPFLVEGLLQGALGAAAALGLLYGAFDALQPYVEQGLSLVFAAGALRFFTPIELGIGVAFGGFIGVLGARAAAAQYLEV